MAAPDGDRILRVDMTTQTASFDKFPADRKLLGGRALSAKILLEECDPACDPLGRDNVLVMAPGVLSGTSAPTSGRISMGGKSPLTGGIKEANSGGTFGFALGQIEKAFVQHSPLCRIGMTVRKPVRQHISRYNHGYFQDDQERRTD